MSLSPALAERFRRAAIDRRAARSLILRDGAPIWSYTAPDAAEDEPLATASVAKLVVGIGVARALATGAIADLRTPASTWLYEWAGTDHEAIALRHLLRHESGLQVTWNGEEDGGDDGPTVTEVALALPLVRTPGDGVMAYNNHGAQLVAEVVRRATGHCIDAWLDREVFSPLGITTWTWQRDRNGLPYGMAGLNIRTTDLAKLGELVRNDGCWEGERLLPAGHFDPRPTAGVFFGQLTMQLPYGYEAVVDLTGATLDEDLLALVGPLDGTTIALEGPDGLFAHVRGDLDLEAARARFRSFQAATPGLSFRPEPVRMFGHNGSGGQHLWIVPAAGVVGVQQRPWDGAWSDELPGEDFQDLLFEAFA